MSKPDMTIVTILALTSQSVKQLNPLKKEAVCHFELRSISHLDMVDYLSSSRGWMSTSTTSTNCTIPGTWKVRLKEGRDRGRQVRLKEGGKERRQISEMEGRKEGRTEEM